MWLPNNDSPGLAMARAFGDFCLKDFGLISVPEISYRRLTEKDEFIVLATDGVVPLTFLFCFILISTTIVFSREKNAILLTTSAHPIILPHFTLTLSHLITDMGCALKQRGG